MRNNDDMGIIVLIGLLIIAVIMVLVYLLATKTGDSAGAHGLPSVSGDADIEISSQIL